MTKIPFIERGSTKCMSTRTEQQVEKDIVDFLTEIITPSDPTPPPPHLPPHPVIMPECADFLLSQIDISDLNNEVTALFHEYFIRESHKFFNGTTNPRNEKDKIYEALMYCDFDVEVTSEPVVETEKKKATIQQAEADDSHPLDDLSEVGCCLPCSCLTLMGNRRVKKVEYQLNQPDPPTPPSLTYGIKKLLQPDLIWLFYFERMGIFKILGAILDDFVHKGKLPIPTDKVTALILEMMTRNVKVGFSSTVRDRVSTYARVLAWKQNGPNPGMDLDKILTNSAFTRLFHRFIVLALAYYADRRLADAIQGTVTPLPSTATIIAIQDTIDLLKNSMESFTYGRNYYNTLNGIVWVIATVDLIHKLKDTIGIPASFTRLDQIIPAAYSILIENKSINQSDPNRYKLHYECAQDARDMLIDIAGNAFRYKDTNELKLWLNIVESRIEGYRSAYRELTRIDLGRPEFRTEGTLTIEQQI
jgi:hypothetical protein